MDKNRLLTVLSFFIMITFGFIVNIQGVILPSVRQDFAVSYETIGLILLLSSLGFAAATFAGGIAADRYGQKTVLILASLVLALGMGLMPLANSFLLFALVFFLINIGMGGLEIGVNSLGARIFLTNTAVMMNFLHLFYGLGSTLGPRYAGLMLAGSYNWQEIYFFTLILIVIMLIFLIFSPFPGSKADGNYARVHVQKLAGDSRIWLLSAVLGFAIVLEMGIANWLVNFLVEVREMAEDTGALYLSFFFVTFTLGRLVGGYLAEKLGYLKIIIYFAGISILLFLTGLSSISQGAVFFSLIGFFVSTMYPTIMAVIFREFKENTAGAVGFITTAAVFINMLFNWLIGRSSDLFGVFYGFGSIVIYTALIIVFSLLLERRLSPLAAAEKHPGDYSDSPQA